jgi:hypothetical protein
MRVLATLFLFIAAPIGAQTHCDLHYRWQEKIDATAYELTAWARRRKVQNGATGDGDWHIELTSSRTGAVTNCIVTEIPPG